MPLNVRIFSSIEEVPQPLWDGLVGEHSCTFSYAFWQVIERSGLNDFSYRYALFVNDEGEPVALAVFYVVTTDIAIFASKALREKLAKIRRYFPNFLKIRMLECGTPITLNSPPFIASPKVSLIEVVLALDNVLKRIARKEKHLLIIVRDFEPDAEAIEPLFIAKDYCLVESLPNNYLPVRWQTPEEYTDQMKSYYRCKLVKHTKRALEQGFHYKVLEDFADMAPTLRAQWLVVHDNAREFQREILTTEFYQEFSNRMERKSKAIVFYQDEQPVAHTLLLQDGKMLRWLYFGRTIPVNDSLYIFAAHKVIEVAINLGVERLEMGLTTYPIKQDLGSHVTPIHIAIKSPWRIINPLVKRIYPLINHVPKLENKEIFKSANTCEKA